MLYFLGLMLRYLTAILHYGLVLCNLNKWVIYLCSVLSARVISKLSLLCYCRLITDAHTFCRVTYQILAQFSLEMKSMLRCRIVMGCFLFLVKNPEVLHLLFALFEQGFKIVDFDAQKLWVVLLAAKWRISCYRWAACCGVGLFPLPAALEMIHDGILQLPDPQVLFFQCEFILAQLTPHLTKFNLVLILAFMMKTVRIFPFIHHVIIKSQGVQLLTRQCRNLLYSLLLFLWRRRNWVTFPWAPMFWEIKCYGLLNVKCCKVVVLWEIFTV